MEKYKGNLCEGLYLVRDIHYEQIEKIWELTQKTELDPEDPEYMHPFASSFSVSLPESLGRLLPLPEVEVPFVEPRDFNIKRFFSVVKHIDNIIEDGYIEQAFMEKYR